MSAPDLPRFKVASVTGYTELGRQAATGYYVLDTWDVHRVVWSNPVPTGHSGAVSSNITRAQRRERAETRCAELEAWHAKAMSNDPA